MVVKTIRFPEQRWEINTAKKISMDPKLPQSVMQYCNIIFCFG